MESVITLSSSDHTVINSDHRVKILNDIRIIQLPVYIKQIRYTCKLYACVHPTYRNHPKSIPHAFSLLTNPAVNGNI